MSLWSCMWLYLLLAPIVLVAGGQQCYFGPGADNRGPDELVPCAGSGDSACCLQGDTCLAGNTCYNHATGDLYQFGCTDIHYEASVCPYKCGFNTTLSPWTALEYCSDIDNVTDTWVCHAPESCGCSWNSTYDLLILTPRGCKEMGSNARVALYAPSTLAPWISLPSTVGGSTGYYSPTTVNGTISTWVETAIPGYTPSTITQLTTYGNQPRTPVLVEPGQTAAPSTAVAASSILPTASSTSSTSSTSNIASTSTGAPTLVTSTPAPSPVSGLSIGAKAGIGVGAAAGACLVLLAAIMIYRKRKQSKQHTQGEVQQHLQGPQFPQGPGYPQGPYNPQSPPMQQQGFPYYPSPPQPHEKTGTWQQGTYLPGSPPLPSPAPYYTGTNTSLSPQPFDSPSPYGELPKAPVSPPLELSAEQRVHEMAHSNVDSVSAISSPSPTYVEIEAPRK